MSCVWRVWSLSKNWLPLFNSFTAPLFSDWTSLERGFHVGLQRKRVVSLTHAALVAVCTEVEVWIPAGACLLLGPPWADPLQLWGFAPKARLLNLDSVFRWCPSSEPTLSWSLRLTQLLLRPMQWRPFWCVRVQRLSPTAGLLCTCVCEQCSKGLLYASPLRGSPVCVSRCNVTPMCQLCLEEWTENWWTTMTHTLSLSLTHTHTQNLLRVLPMITHTHSWHFSLKRIYRLPMYGCTWHCHVTHRPCKSLSLYICLLHSRVMACVRVCSPACLFSHPAGQIRECVCVFVH